MSNKGKKRVKCNKSTCGTHGYLTLMEKSCLDDDGIAWMCERHDDQRIFEENARST